jgi:hypothetical protein
VRLRGLLPIVGLAVGTALCAANAEAQRRAVRFEIIAVGDSTLQFKVGTAGWVRRGQSGTAVDPRKRDELVARFRIMRVRDGSATALVTGQTTALSTEHIATLEEPKRPWFRAKTFWSGLVLGAALGIAGVAVNR